MRIVRFQLKNLRRILQIESESFPADEWPRDLFIQYADSCPLFLVAKVGRVIAGYAITSVRDKRAELLSLAVSRRFRRQGIAAQMLRFTIQRLRAGGVRFMMLMVRRNNVRAIDLYRRFRFVRVRTVAGYYEDGETAWRMKKTLSPHSQPE
ncbi:MAG: GNAT family N-acetyltransferase [Acidobacteriaceae bacterium]|nr:GNAT family N-acetyltransferase [Acidobacteriaceae bacterium]